MRLNEDIPIPNEDIAKFKTYVKLLNKRIKEMGGEMSKLKEENKFMKKRLDHVESTLFMINTTLLSGNMMNKQVQMQNMNQMMPQQFGMPNQYANMQNMQNNSPQMMYNQNQRMVQQNNLQMMQNHQMGVNQMQQQSPQGNQQNLQNHQAPNQKMVINSKSKPFEKKMGAQAERTNIGSPPIQSASLRNDYISPAEEEDIEFEPKNNMANKLMSQIEDLDSPEQHASGGGGEFMELEENIRAEVPLGENKSQNTVHVVQDLSSPELAQNEERFVFLWKLFLESEVWLESIVLLDEMTTKLLMQKVIDLEVNAQLLNDMDLLSLVFRWLFELISLPQFEPELFVFLESELFLQENRYFDDSQLDMSEICVNSTDITTIIQQNQFSLGFKVWKTTIFTISAYENEEIMEHCHKIVSYMRQKSMGSVVLDEMSGIPEEPHKFNGIVLFKVKHYNYGMDLKAETWV